MTGRALLILGLSTGLAACVTPRLHSEAELSRVALACGLPLSDLVQDAELKKVLILMTVAPTRQERSCVRKWARKRKLHLAYIAGINRVGQ